MTVLEGNLTIFVNQTTEWTYYILKPASNPDPFALIELLVDPPHTVPLLLCHRQKSPPLYLPESHYLVADGADYEGWFSMKSQHSLALTSEVLEAGTNVGVRVNDSSSRYQLRVRTARVRECPFGCSGNGRCTLEGTCDCLPLFTASDCSIPTHILRRRIPQEVYLSPTVWTHFLINFTECARLSVNWSVGELEVLTKTDSEHLSMLPSESEYTKKYRSSVPFIIDFPSPSAHTWRIAIRAANNSLSFPVTLLLSDSSGDNSLRVVWALTVTSVTAAIVLGGLAAWKAWRYRQRKMEMALNEQRTTISGIPANIIDAHFPTQRFPAQKTSAQPYPCPICLDTIIPGAVLRTLPCSHCFHAKCLDTWFLSSTTCSACHRDYSALIDRGMETGEKGCERVDESIKTDQTTQNDTMADLQPAASERSDPPVLFSFRS